MDAVPPPPVDTTKALRKARRRKARVWGPFTISLLVHGVAAAIVLVTVSHVVEEKPKPLCVQCVEIVDLNPQEEADRVSDELPEADPVDVLELQPFDTPPQEEPEQRTELPPIDDDAPRDVQRLEVHDMPLDMAKPRKPATPPATTPSPPVAKPTPPRAAPQPARRPARVRTANRLKLVSRPNLMRYYPEEARQRGVEGEALVEITVDRTGKVTQATLIRSSGSALLDRQAIRVMYAYRFEAGAGGRARVPVNFRLQ